MSVVSRGTAVILWAVAGVTLIFLVSIYRLGNRGLQTVSAGLTSFEWTVLIVLTLLFVYGEGYRAIQKRFTPHMMDRLTELRSITSPGLILAAPLYALSLISAPRRIMIRTWIGVFAILGAVFIVRAFPEPWRGITDLAVAAALTWGLTAILVAAARLPSAAPHLQSPV